MGEIASYPCGQHFTDIGGHKDDQDDGKIKTIEKIYFQPNGSKKERCKNIGRELNDYFFYLLGKIS